MGNNGFVNVNISMDLNELSKSLWELYWQWHLLHAKAETEYDDLSQCMIQMIIVKTRTLEQMFTGVSMYPDMPQLGGILDISSMAAIVRSIYESTYIYHSIFVDKDSSDETDLLLCLWRIRGLNNIRKFPIPSELKGTIKQNDKAVIKKYKNKIFDILNCIKISDSAKNKFIGLVNNPGTTIKGYEFVKDDKKEIIDIKEFGFTDTAFLFGHNNYEEWYTFLSSHSHPSYNGFSEFGSMYQNNHDKDILIGLIMMAHSIIAQFVRDWCNVITDGDKIKGKVFPTISSIDFI